MHEQQLPSILADGPPGVPVHLFYGTNLSTPIMLSWAGLPSFEHAPIPAAFSEGDGVVTLASLLDPERFAQQVEPVFHHPFPNIGHVEMACCLMAVASVLADLYSRGLARDAPNCGALVTFIVLFFSSQNTLCSKCLF